MDYQPVKICSCVVHSVMDCFKGVERGMQMCDGKV